MVILQKLFTLDVQIAFLNAALVSIASCGIALWLSRRTERLLAARHVLLTVTLVTAILIPLFGLMVPLSSFGMFRSYQTSPTSFSAIQEARDTPQGLFVPAPIEAAMPDRVTSAIGEPVQQPAETGLNVTAGQATIAQSAAAASVSRSTLSTLQPGARSPGLSWPRLFGGLLCLIWLVGAFYGTLCLLVSLTRLRQLFRRLTPVESDPLQAIARQAAGFVGLTTPVPIYQSPLLPAPATLGWIRPRIVIPAGLETSLNPDQLRAVLQHEMAHIARRDTLIGLLQQAAQIAYWWNPLVRLLNRELADLREMICDEVATRGLSDPGQFASTLIDLAERCGTGKPVPAMIGIGSMSTRQLEQRIRRILSQGTRRSDRGARWSAASVCLAWLMTTAGALCGQIQAPTNPAGVVPGMDESSAGAGSEQSRNQPADEGEHNSSGDAAPKTVVAKKDPFDRGWGELEIPGRVVDEEGHPVKGAVVYWKNYGLRTPIRKTESDAEGNFVLHTFRQNPVILGGDRTDQDEIRRSKHAIMATAPGYGFGTLAAGDDVVIRLVPDTAIEGQVTDEAGQPVKGARVRVRDIQWPRQPDDPIAIHEDRYGRGPLPPIPEGKGLDPWMDAIRRAANMNDFFVARQFLISLIESNMLGDRPAFYEPLVPAVVTDAEGKFTLRGVGVERVAELYVDQVPGASSLLVLIANRPLENPVLIPAHSEGVKRLIWNPGRDLPVYGQAPVISLPAGRSIEGVVTDFETGQPLPHVRIVGPAITRLEYPGFDRFFTSTDERGHYRIEGLPLMKHAAFNVFVDERGNQQDEEKDLVDAVPYFGREIDVSISAGMVPLQIDVPLTRGIWITGKVVDDVTGEGLPDAHIEYHAFNENSFLKKLIEAGMAPDFGESQRTGPDGSFRLRGLAGRGIVTANGGSEYLDGIGVDQIRGLKRDEYFNALYRVGGFSPYIRSTTIEVEISENEKIYECELRLKKGKSRTLQIVEPAGDPITDLEGSGLLHQIENPIRKIGAQKAIEIRNLFAGERREVVVRSVSRKLIGMAVVAEAETEAVSLELVPWANVSGRLIDEAGQPRSRGLRIQLEDGKLPIHTLNGINYDKQEFLIEQDGRFQILGMVPGAKYRLRVIEDGFLILGEATDIFLLKPDETRDLGDLKVKKPKEDNP